MAEAYDKGNMEVKGQVIWTHTQRQIPIPKGITDKIRGTPKIYNIIIRTSARAFYVTLS